jgi:hypothetical protein
MVMPSSGSGGFFDARLFPHEATQKSQMREAGFRELSRGAATQGCGCEICRLQRAVWASGHWNQLPLVTFAGCHIGGPVTHRGRRRCRAEVPVSSRRWETDRSGAFHEADIWSSRQATAPATRVWSATPQPRVLMTVANPNAAVDNKPTATPRPGTSRNRFIHQLISGQFTLAFQPRNQRQKSISFRLLFPASLKWKR